MTTLMKAMMALLLLPTRVLPTAVGHWRRRATEWFAPWESETLTLTLTESDSLPNVAAS